MKLHTVVYNILSCVIVIPCLPYCALLVRFEPWDFNAEVLVRGEGYCLKRVEGGSRTPMVDNPMHRCSSTSPGFPGICCSLLYILDPQRERWATVAQLVEVFILALCSQVSFWNGWKCISSGGDGGLGVVLDWHYIRNIHVHFWFCDCQHFAEHSVDGRSIQLMETCFQKRLCPSELCGIFGNEEKATSLVTEF